MSEVKVEDSISIDLDGKKKILTMHYGLLSTLAKVVGDIEGVSDVAFDANLRDQILIEVLSERDEEGTIQKQANLYTLPVSKEDVLKILDWVGGHVADFLLEQMVQTKAHLDRHQKTLAGLMPTSTGSPA